ncbi:hypothetical protein [Butyrivibrio sp. NC3005]|uniref:hypothetical protein n=1 Tax=Butyrivibrio sp. NC3005 TaxID=1280685 RepID=UPI00041C1D8F|nr:hypothetical protein [Butyrivibrio sp. NC3005]
MQASKYRLIGIVLVTSTLFAGLLTGCDGLTSSSKSAATPSNSASYVISESLAGTSHSSKAKGINENDKHASNTKKIESRDITNVSSSATSSDIANVNVNMAAISTTTQNN